MLHNNKSKKSGIGPPTPKHKFVLLPFRQDKADLTKVHDKQQEKRYHAFKGVKQIKPGGSTVLTP